MAKKEDKIQIKQFKDNSSFWWVNGKVYCLDKNNELQFVCGGVEDKKETEEITQFIKRNKKQYLPRAKSQIDEISKTYTVITFGKFANKPLDEIVAVDKRYAKWLYTNISDIKIKKELEELLGIKK